MSGKEGVLTLTPKRGATAVGPKVVTRIRAAAALPAGTILELASLAPARSAALLREGGADDVAGGIRIRTLRGGLAARLSPRLPDGAYTVDRPGASLGEGDRLVFLERGQPTAEAAPTAFPIRELARALGADVVVAAKGGPTPAGLGTRDLVAIRVDGRAVALPVTLLLRRGEIGALARASGASLFAPGARTLFPAAAKRIPEPPAWRYSAAQAARAKTRGTYPRRIVIMDPPKAGRPLSFPEFDTATFNGLGVFEAAPATELNLALSLNGASAGGEIEDAVRRAALAGRADVVAVRGRAWRVFRLRGGRWSEIGQGRPPPNLGPRAVHEWLRSTLGFDGVVVESRGEFALVEGPTYLAAPGRHAVIDAGGGLVALAMQVTATAPLAAYRLELTRRGARIATGARLKMKPQ